MPVCAKCGHEFDVGRFCTNCGHPVDSPVETTDESLAFWRTDTNERPAEPAAPPPETTPPEPPPVPPDTSARYPLFADQVTTPVREETSSHRAGRPWLPWVAGAAALLLVAGLGIWLLLDSGGSDPDLVADDPQSTPGDASPPNKPAKPKKPKKEKTTAPSPAGKPANVASLATADVPATAAPSTDFDGDTVQYDAGNMLDGVPATCWRMPGDGSGDTITVELAEETELTSVGLINGYAKTGTDGSGTALDWYTGNRRILAVEWVFDDGSVVTQDLAETRELQREKLEPVTTSTVQLRLLTVTTPGQGPSRRDYTAISELALVGAPA
jgi:hypothetical protein